MTRIVLFPHNHTTASNTILQHLVRSPFGTRYPDAVALESDPDRLVRQLRPYMTAGGFVWPFGPIPLGDRSETWCADEGVVNGRESKVGVPATPMPHGCWMRWRRRRPCARA